MSFDCGVSDCKATYTTVQSLRQHQRKKHSTEYAQNSLMIRKKQRIEEPLPSHLAPKATFVVNDDPALELAAHETCQVALANTRLHLDDQIDHLRADITQISSGHSALLAQLTDLHQRFKLLAKQNAKWCVVCYERENDFAFLPCGHKCMCEQCANMTLAKKQPCPICRQNIAKIQRIYDIHAFV